jgi:undecaprenyl-phosphate galactose phosphotransferase
MKPIESFLTARAKEANWLCSPTFEKWLLSTTDLIAMAAAYLLSAAFMLTAHDALTTNVLRDLQSSQDPVRLKCYIVLVAVTVAVFWSKGHYTKRKPFSNEVREILVVSAILGVLDAALVFFGKWQFSRGELVFTWMSVPCFVVAFRTLLKVALMRMGAWNRQMVIVGWGENAVETALAFEDEKLMGYSLTAFLIPHGKRPVSTEFMERLPRPIPCIGLGDRPRETLDRLGRPHIVLALEQGGIDMYQDFIQELSRSSQNVQVVPSIRGLPLYGMEVNHFFAHEVLVLTVRNNLARRVPKLIKRLFDVFVSSSLLIIGLPLLLWISIRVRASGGAVFYGHQRIGQNKRPFACYKFRTMAPNADKLLSELLARDPEARTEWERDFKLKNDPRITSIGHFLRRTSLDELPQLWNVLKGDMSLVGPRPVVTAELERYGNQVEYYLEAKPGITGLWQISGRNDISYAARVYLDAWYVKNWSLFNDIVILLRTVKVIFRKEGAY